MNTTIYNTARLFFVVILAFAILLILPFRILAGVFVITSFLFYLLHFRWQTLTRVSWGFLVAAIVATFLPFDISFHNSPGMPHVVPYVCGLPSKVGIEKYKKGEILLSFSCMVDGKEPKYVLVW